MSDKIDNQPNASSRASIRTKIAASVGCAGLLGLAFSLAALERPPAIAVAETDAYCSISMENDGQLTATIFNTHSGQAMISAQLTAELDGSTYRAENNAIKEESYHFKGSSQYSRSMKVNLADKSCTLDPSFERSHKYQLKK